jgi:type IV pilus assembly protein PilY1
MEAPTLLKRILCHSLSIAIAVPGPVYAANTDIFNEPLAQPASNVKPNIMLLHDDSGSMRQQYTPDYIGRAFGGSNPHCYDSADGGSIGSTLENCDPGDPPLMSPDFNFQYYNPEIRYYPAVNSDGTAMPSMDALNTADWTKVATDGVSSSSITTFRRTTLDMNGDDPTLVEYVDLTTGYPDRAWCVDSSQDHTDPAYYPTRCRLNSNYTYPNLNFGYGRNGDGSIKYVFGAPYYYRLVATEYCTDPTFTTCTAATAPTGAYTLPAKVRFCDSTTLTNCQAKYQGNFTRPKFTGVVAGVGGSNPPTRATATITVGPQSDTFSGVITGVFANGVNILSVASIGATGPINDSLVATDLAFRLTGSGYSATASGNVVTVRAPTDGALYNGHTLVVRSPTATKSPASVTLSISSVSSGESLTSMTTGVNANLIGSTIKCDGGSGCGNNYSGPNGASGRNGWMAVQIAGAINGQTVNHGYTATQSGSTVTITAPAVAPLGPTGAEINGQPLEESSPGFDIVASAPSTAKAFSGGQTSGDIETTTTNFSGGTDANEGRIQTGQWVRVNVVPFLDAAQTVPSTFQKFPSRTDCAAATCTYAEEMTNFANWYAYYRSRAQMAKTAVGRAFIGITDSYRVGFMTINPQNPVNTGRFLAVNDFASGSGSQKDSWYQKLYDTDTNGSTPLREALSRVGHYYAGATSTYNFNAAPSPIQVSCQPSYTILVTDGYWNGNQGRKLDGTLMDNQDNVNAGYSTRTVGAYDGNILPTTVAGDSPGGSGTLADVAMYYYKNDLRTDLADNVPTTTRDTAPHQHMTTFTVGLGLAGRLNFQSNYQEQTSGDFMDIKQGVKNWPSPQRDSETALDDLWHAAVNGRGTFFSAKNPTELASGITQTLQAVQSRVGAGAAAATSNLQPVAGDNFAFTAQFQTVQWTGDVKARTIDLSTGIIASRELWSAQNLLDQRNQYNRRIYTFDASDVPPPGGSGPVTGNGLRNFCWSGASPTSTPAYPGCDDDASLAAADLTTYFDPLTLPHAATWPTDTSGRDVTATGQNLVDYLRGDTANQMTGGTSPTDLYRSRVSLLGDVVNAQPAYVKAPPFNYSAVTNPYYAEYRTTNATRRGTVYVAANDGMLHAFETDPDNSPYFQTAGITTATTSDDSFSGTLNTSATAGEGAERWAYIPSLVLSSMKTLASSPYTHRYYVDGSPTVGDVCFGHTSSVPCAAAANWKTILVGGLNSGGRGFYALDVTNPLAPRALWEFKGGADAACIAADSDVDGTQTGDCNVGLTYGNPIITKLPSSFVPAASAGKWAVIVTSATEGATCTSSTRRPGPSSSAWAPTPATPPRRAACPASTPGRTTRAATIPRSRCTAGTCSATCGASSSRALPRWRAVP